MGPRTRRAVLVPLAAALAGGLGACAGWPPLVEEVRDASAPHRADQGVDVRARNGAITIEATSAGDSARVEATLRMETQERLAATTVTVDRRPDGVLEVFATPPGDEWRSNEGCSFIVRLADAAAVEAATSNGAVRLARLSGSARVETSNGSIQVNGSSGPIEARTSNGSIVLDGVAGPVRASSSNGGVRVRLDPGATGPVAIDTSNGSIELDVGGAFAGRVRLRTSNGALRYPTDILRVERDGRDRADITLGPDGPESSLTTSNGAITVRRSGS